MITALTHLSSQDVEAGRRHGGYVQCFLRHRKQPTGKVRHYAVALKESSTYLRPYLLTYATSSLVRFRVLPEMNSRDGNSPAAPSRYVIEVIALQGTTGLQL